MTQNKKTHHCLAQESLQVLHTTHTLIEWNLEQLEIEQLNLPGLVLEIAFSCLTCSCSTKEKNPDVRRLFNF